MDNSSWPPSSPSSTIPEFEFNPPPPLLLSTSSYFASLEGFSPSRFLDSPSSHPSQDVVDSFERFNNNEEEQNLFFNFSFQTLSNMTSFLESSDAMLQSELLSQEPRNEKVTTTSKYPLTQTCSLEPHMQINDHIAPASPSYTNNNMNLSQSKRKQNMIDDGYSWRKYGQKNLTGSENLRIYFKCTHTSCNTKKLVGKASDGQIIEIVYKGTHNHPKPQSNGGSSSQSIQPSSFCNNPMKDQSVMNLEKIQMELTPLMEDSSLFVVDNEYDYDPDTKRCKGDNEIDGYATFGNRIVKEPRVVIQTRSEIDVLDDGYKWRKYGQKVVKENPNPRSYYKCTTTGCSVRKQIERSTHDMKDVITTYEGKHNHDVPVARGKESYNINATSLNNGNNVTAPIWPSPFSALSDSSFTDIFQNPSQMLMLPTPSQRPTFASQEPFSFPMLPNPSQLPTSASQEPPPFPMLLNPSQLPTFAGQEPPSFPMLPNPSQLPTFAGQKPFPLSMLPNPFQLPTFASQEPFPFLMLPNSSSFAYLDSVKSMGSYNPNTFQTKIGVSQEEVREGEG